MEIENTSESMQMDSEHSKWLADSGPKGMDP